MPNLGLVAIRIYPRNFSWEECAGPSPAAHQYYYNDERHFRKVSSSEAATRIYQKMPMPEVEVGIQIGRFIERNPHLLLIWVQVMAGPHLITSITKNIDEVRSTQTIYTRPFQLEEAQKSSNIFTVVFKALTLGMGSTESEFRCDFSIDEEHHPELSFSDRFVNGCNAFDRDLYSRPSSSRNMSHERNGQNPRTNGPAEHKLRAREAGHRNKPSRNSTASASHHRQHEPRRYEPCKVPRSDSTSGYGRRTHAEPYCGDGFRSKPVHTSHADCHSLRDLGHSKAHHSKTPFYPHKTPQVPQQSTDAFDKTSRVPDAIRPMELLSTPEAPFQRAVLSSSATAPTVVTPEAGQMQWLSEGCKAHTSITSTVTPQTSTQIVPNGAVNSAPFCLSETKEVTMKDVHDEPSPLAPPQNTGNGHKIGIVSPTCIAPVAISSSGQVVSLHVVAESSSGEMSAEAHTEARREAARRLRREVVEARDHLIAVKQEYASCGDLFASTSATSLCGNDEGNTAAEGQSCAVKTEPTLALDCILDATDRKDPGTMAKAERQEVDMNEQIVVKLEKGADQQLDFQETTISAAGAEPDHNSTLEHLRMPISPATTSTAPLKSNLRRTDSGSKSGKRVRISVPPEAHQTRKPHS